MNWLTIRIITKGHWPTKAFTNMYPNAQVQVISNENYAEFIGW